MNWWIFLSCFFGYVTGWFVRGKVELARRRREYNVRAHPSYRHPAWSEVPPGHCSVCKATPAQDCDAGLHS
jgi:hypothetical protein